MEDSGLVAVDYLLIGLGLEILEVVGFIDDKLCLFFGETFPTPSISRIYSLMLEYIFLDFIVIFDEMMVLT